MALEALKYGNFKPQQVFQEAKSLPGFGGDPTAWADYRFQVEAVQAREEKISDTERWDPCHFALSRGCKGQRFRWRSNLEFQPRFVKMEPRS